MTKPVKRRPYDSSARKAAASETRQAILAAAQRVFQIRGYAGATMTLIAEEAGIALDTVYASVGKKAALMRLLVETAISGTDAPVPAEERDYVRAIRAAPDAAGKIDIYAAALGSIQPRLAPLFRVLQSAADLDPDLGALWREISKRRAANMKVFAQDLIATGEVREDLSLTQVADIVWSMNAPEFYLLLAVQRGWTALAFQVWLADAWKRLLLEAPNRRMQS